ncbi:hypothetical protein REPUB_Repub15cG0008100 [Reevesia pubescens]
MRNIIENTAVVFSENLPEEFRSINLLGLFSKFGKIMEAIMRVVEAMNGKVIQDKRIFVNMARFNKLKRPVSVEDRRSGFEGRNTITDFQSQEMKSYQRKEL